MFLVWNVTGKIRSFITGDDTFSSSLAASSKMKATDTGSHTLYWWDTETVADLTD